MQFPETHVLDVKVSGMSVEDLNAYVVWAIQNRPHSILPYINVHGINTAYKAARFREFINSCPVVSCDGAGVAWAAQRKGLDISARITYADWAVHLARISAQEQLSLYFLGGQPGVAQAAFEALLKSEPELCIAGYQHGYFDKTAGSSENEAVIQAINAAQPDILLVGFGMPLQEYWLEENAARLNASLMLTSGAVFDYISGCLPRGPKWMTDNGLEWLARLIIEPRRLWRRYVLGLPSYIWRLFWNDREAIGFGNGNRDRV